MYAPHPSQTPLTNALTKPTQSDQLSVSIVTQIAAGCFAVVRFQQEPSLLRFLELSLVFIGVRTVCATITLYTARTMEFLGMTTEGDFLVLATSLLYPALGLMVVRRLYSPITYALLMSSTKYLGVTILLSPAILAFIFIGSVWISVQYIDRLVNVLMWIVGFGFLLVLHNLNRYFEREHQRKRNEQRWEQYWRDGGRVDRPI